MRTLLTGFGPFMNVLNNPTTRIVEHFASVGAEGHELTAVVLPVSYRRAEEEISRLLSEGGFDLAILMGVAARSEKIRLELFGRNRSSIRKKDADEEAAAGPIRAEGKALLSATISTRGLVRKLQEEGIAARVSRSAGDYVCNHTYYAALSAIAEKGLNARCLFVHLPCDEETLAPGTETPTMPLSLQVRAITLLLQAFAGGTTPP